MKLKRILSLILAILTVIAAVPLTNVKVRAANTTSDGFSYEITDGEVTITGYSGSSTEITIPSKIDGMPVVKIGYKAFYLNWDIRKLTFEEGVKTISDYAFSRCDSLEEVILPESLEIISDEAFTASSIKKIVIPKNVHTVRPYAFNNCKSLNEIVLMNENADISRSSFSNTAYYNDPANWDNGVLYLNNILLTAEKLTSSQYTVRPSTIRILNSAFSFCRSLTSVVISEGVKTIGDRAFSGCSSLASISLPESLEYVGDNAFVNTAYYNNSSNWTNNVLYIGNVLVYSKQNTPDLLKIKDSTTLIAYSALDGSDSRFTKLYIPKDLKYINDTSFFEGSRAFVKDIFYEGSEDDWNKINFGGGRGSSESCKITFDCTVDSYGIVYKLDHEKGEAYVISFSNIAGATEINIPSHIDTLPVTVIGDNVFYGARKLEKVTLPETITKIGDYAFCSCNYMTDINLPDSITEIGDYAFSGDTYVTSWNLPKNLRTIGDYAFQYAYKKMFIEIPDNVEYIGEYAFSGNYNQLGMIIPTSVTYIGTGNLDANNFFMYTKRVLYRGTKEQWKNVNVSYTPTASYDTVIYYEGEADDTGVWYGITDSGEAVVFGTENAIESVSIAREYHNAPVNTILGYAFYNNETLKSIEIHENITFMGSNAFRNTGYYNDSANWDGNLLYLDYVLINDNQSASGMREVKRGTTVIAESTFDNSNGSTFSLPLGLEYINDKAFANAYRCNEITIPPTVKVIGAGALSSYLNTIYYPGSEEDWNKIDIHETAIPKSCSIVFNKKVDYNYTVVVDKITYYVNLDTGTVEIKDCDTSATSVVIPDTIEGLPVTSVGVGAFGYCSSLEYLKLPDTIVSIEKYAFRRTDKLAELYLPEGLTSIGEFAFEDSNGLVSIDIPNSVTSMGEGVFYSCDNLVSCSFTSGISEIPKSTFYNCSSLENLEFKGDITTIGVSAFGSAFSTNLSEFSIPEGVTTICEYAFRGANLPEDISLPSTLKTIENYSFYSVKYVYTVHFNGPRAMWDNVSVGSYNTAIENAVIICVDDESWVPTDLEYYVDTEKNEIVVTGYSGSSTVLYIPEKIEGLPVTTIADNAFSYNNTVTALYIPKTVTSIGLWASFTKLQKITVDNDNEHYYSDGASIIERATKTLTHTSKNTTIPDDGSVVKIGDYAFFETQIASIVIPECITEIGKRAFTYCQNLQSVTFEGAIKKIGDEAFYGCSKIKTITLSNGIESIGSYAFANCAGLTSINVSGNILEIGSYAFTRCISLTSITLTGSVSEIGSYAFNDCSALSSFTVPTGVSAISDGMFYNCTALKTVNIGDNVTAIGSYAFSGCEALSGITGARSVESIGDRAFRSCSALTSFDLPAGLKSIGSHAFNACKSLKEITIPESLTSISEYAYYACSSLEKINILSYLTMIGDSAFDRCDNIKNVYFIGSEVYWNNFVTVRANNECLTSATFEFGDEDTAHPDFEFELDRATNTVIVTKYIGSESEIIIPEEICGLPVYAVGPNDYFSSFADENKITMVVIPEGVVRINDYTFDGFTKLTTVVLPSTLKEIGCCAFNCCSSLTTIELPKALEVIEDGAFKYSGLTNINFNDGIKNIGSSAFAYCKSLSSVTLPENDSTIFGEMVFNQCYSLKTLIIPDCYTDIDPYSFAGIGYLNEIVIPEGVTEIGEGAFMDSGINYITLNSGLKTIGDFAFAGNFFTFIRMPKTVTYIGNHAFYACAYLESINIPEGITRIEEGTFYYCFSLVYATLPQSITYIGENAFMDAESLYRVYFNGEYPQWQQITIESGNEAIHSSEITWLYYDTDKLTGNTEEYRWCLTSGQSSAAIISYNGTSKEVYIPESIHGFTVSQISSMAFASTDNAQEITIPATVKSIGYYAFDSYNIQTIICDGTEKDFEGIDDFYFNGKLYFVRKDGSITARSTLGSGLYDESFTAAQVNISSTSAKLSDEYDFDNALCYSFSFASNGVKTSLAGDVTYVVPLPDGMSGAYTAVLYVNADGSLTKLDSEFKNGNLVFSHNKTGYFIIASKAFTTTPGDVDCDGAFTSMDSNYLRRYVAGNMSVEVGSDIFYALDVNSDGALNAMDSNLIRRILAGVS